MVQVAGIEVASLLTVYAFRHPNRNIFSNSRGYNEVTELASADIGQ